MGKRTYEIERFLLSVIATSILALNATSGQAQGWSHYLRFDDRFSVDFPSEPSIQETTYATEFGLTLPARIYTAEDNFGNYTVTAVDWREAEALHAEAYDNCVKSTGDRHGGDNPGHCSRLYAGMEIRGSTLHAAFSFLERDSDVSHFGYTHAERVEGIGIQLHNEDGSLTHAVIYWHDYRLYIAEAFTPPGAPPPILFATSFGFLDEEGHRITYSDRYTPLFPAPPRTR